MFPCLMALRGLLSPLFRWLNKSHFCFVATLLLRFRSGAPLAASSCFLAPVIIYVASVSSPHPLAAEDYPALPTPLPLVCPAAPSLLALCCYNRLGPVHCALLWAPSNHLVLYSRFPYPACQSPPHIPQGKCSLGVCFLGQLERPLRSWPIDVRVKMPQSQLFVCRGESLDLSTLITPCCHRCSSDNPLSEVSFAITSMMNRFAVVRYLTLLARSPRESHSSTVFVLIKILTKFQWFPFACIGMYSSS